MNKWMDSKETLMNTEEGHVTESYGTHKRALDPARLGMRRVSQRS